MVCLHYNCFTKFSLLLHIMKNASWTFMYVIVGEVCLKRSTTFGKKTGDSSGIF